MISYPVEINKKRYIFTEFLSSGTFYRPTLFPVTICWVLLIGGGAGGKATASSNVVDVWGGGAGAWLERMVFLTQSSYTVTIGAGGAGGTKSGSGTALYGGTGGDSSFGVFLVAKGGKGQYNTNLGGDMPYGQQISTTTRIEDRGVFGFSGANGGSSGTDNGKDCLLLPSMFPRPASYSGGLCNGGSGAHANGGGGGGGGARGAGGNGAVYTSSGTQDRNGTSAEANTGAGGGGASYYSSYYGYGGNGGSGYCAVIYEVTI